MKLSELKSTLKETLREVIQEELKDILLEAVKSNSQQPTPSTPVAQPASPEVKQSIRENYMNVLGDMKKQFTTGDIAPPQGLKINGPVDTTSPNGKLPDGEVSMDQIMGIMKK